MEICKDADGWPSHGVDLTNHTTDTFGLRHHFIREDNCTTVLDQYCSGKRELFTVIPNSRGCLKCQVILDRLAMNSRHGLFTLITCTSLSSHQNRCNGQYVVVIVKANRCSDNTWRFGIVSSFHYLQVLPPYSSSYSEANCLADVFVWTGELTITGYPSFQDCHSFSDASSHFELERISSAEYDIKFVNQVRGKQSHVNERTRNDVDGGLQSLPTGPCTVP